MNIETYWNQAWKRDRRGKVFLSTMACINIAFAGLNLFLWSVVAIVLADPISWATWSPLGSVNHRPDLFEYPYVLLWGLPLAGSGVAALNNFMGFKRMAKVAALFPISLFAVTVCWWTIFRDTL